MSLLETSVRRPVGVTVGVLLVVLFGLLSLFRIPIQLTPSVIRPQITVTTVWQGATPFEIEREIVDEQEEFLRGVEGLVRLTSESNDSTGTVTLEFAVGTDLDAALLKVSNKLQQVPEYPDDADEPVLSTVARNQNAIAWFVMRAKEGNVIDVEGLKNFVEDVIEPRFERVDGVAQSNVFGGREREIRVVVDAHAVAARGLTVAEVARVLAAENLNTSAGDFDDGKRRFVVRVQGEYASPEDIRNVVLRRTEDEVVYLRDVGAVDYELAKYEAKVRNRGQDAIAVNCQREPGSNVLTVMAGLREALKELNEGVLADRGLEMEQVYDETEYITSAVGIVQGNILVGAALAIGVLLLFLRSGRSTVVVAVAIPVCVIGTFLAVTLLGRTINVVSLAGLAFAVGMVVDNAIVVLENIDRRRRQGDRAFDAALRGTREVAGAVLASTLTTLAVFIPVVFVEQEAGQLFRDIAIAISCGVGISLVVSLTVIPAYSYFLLRRRDGKEKREKPLSLGPLDAFGRKVIGLFVWLSGGTWPIRLAAVGVMTAASILGSMALAPDAEYLPTGNPNLVIGFLLPPPGYSVGELDRMAKDTIEPTLAPHWDRKNPTDPAIENFFFVVTGRNAFMGGRALRSEEAGQLVPLFYKAAAPDRLQDGTFAFVNQLGLFDRGLGEGRVIDVEIRGSNLTKLVGLGGMLFGQIYQMFGVPPRPLPSLDLSSPEMRIIPDRDRLAQLGMTAQDLGFVLNTLVDGAKVSESKIGGETFDLVLEASVGRQLSSEDLERLPVRTPSGELVTVGDVGRVTLVGAPESIRHVETERAITLQVRPPESVPLEQAMRRIRAEVVEPLKQRGALGKDTRIRLGGTADQLTATREALEGNFLLAILISYLLMAALFESFLWPFIIMFSVPLAAVGGFLGLWLTNQFLAAQPLDVLTMLGFVILVGLVVNNAILIVHQALNFMREEGYPPEKAIRESVRTRVRPIFMSVLTSVCGMAPLVLVGGAGSELYRGVGSVVIGGLVVSTLFTLVVVPALLGLAAPLLRGRAKRAASA